MDKATETMIENLYKNTGKSLDQWIDIVKSQNTGKHGEIIKFLKEQHGLTHGYANLIAHKAKDRDAGSITKPDELITKQYVGKEHFKPVYDKLIAEVKRYGKDLEIAPKNSYVSLRRKKQFAILKPATKTRFEIGLNLKGEDTRGKLMPEKPNSMCSHKINIGNPQDVDQEVLDWIRTAYERAG